MASEAEALRREFDITRQELDEMAVEIVSVEEQMSGFARQDLQVYALRAMLEHARRRHDELDQRERALRTKFGSVIGEAPDRLH